MAQLGGRGHGLGREYEVRFRGPRQLRQRLVLLQALSGESVADFLRRVVVTALEDALARQEGLVVALRAGAVCWRERSEGVWVPVGSAVGGERLHVLRSITGTVARTVSPSGVAYAGDVVSSTGGFEARDVLVDAKDLRVYGPTRPQRAAADPRSRDALRREGLQRPPAE